MKKLSKVSINIVTWNSLTYLPHCLNSIFKQSFHDFSVLVIDNNSIDGSIDYIQRNFPEVKILKNTNNLGYARAHNQGIKLKKSDYILVMNPDIILDQDYLKTLVKVADERQDYTSFGGKIKKYHMKNEDLKEIEFTDKIDSIGIKSFKNRRFVNWGEDENDEGQYDQEREVFGISGGLLFLRKEDLEKISVLNEYFDEDFFVYKEDIDFAWRMRIFSLKSVYIPKAIAYHHRQAQAPLSNKIKDIAANRKKKSKFINAYSYRNHLYLLLKNEFLINLIRWFPYIFWYELKKFIYLLFFEPKTLKIYFEIFKNFKKMRKKRKIILSNKKPMIKKLRFWFR